MLDDDPGGPLAEVATPDDDSEATLSPWVVLGGIVAILLIAILLVMMSG